MGTRDRKRVLQKGFVHLAQEPDANIDAPNAACTHAFGLSFYRFD